MKKLFYLGIIVAILGFFMGCEEEPTSPTEEISAPQNLQVATVVGDGLSIELSWNVPSSGTPEKYYIYFEDMLIDSVEDPTTSVQYTPTALGEYYVSAISEDDGEESGWSNSVSTATETGTTGKIFDTNTPSDVGKSGVGWDNSGVSTLYSMADEENNASKVHLYYDAADDFLCSAGVAWSTGKRVLVKTPDTTNFSSLATALSDTSAYGSCTYTDLNNVFYCQLPIGGSDYYAKFKVSEAGTEDGNSYVRLEYAFQTIPRFRRFGSE